MMEQDVLLDEELFDMAATRPPMTLGLPHTLAVSLLTIGLLFLILYGSGDFVDDTIGDIVFIGIIAMVWSTAKVLLRADYHGWGVFCAWLRLDARFLDTSDRGGAGLSSLPIRSIYRCEVYNEHAD